MKKLPKTLKNVLRLVLLSLVAAVIGASLYAANAAKLAGNVIPMPFGVGAAVVLSGSMEPTLSVGDLLIVKEQPGYEVGDIVVYQSGSMPVVHRIVDVAEDTVTTRGDANNVDDAAFPAQAIKGEVIAVLPLVGYLVWALKSPIAVVVMLALAVLLVEWSFRNGKAEKEEEKEKLKAEIRALMDELKEE